MQRRQRSPEETRIKDEEYGSSDSESSSSTSTDDNSEHSKSPRKRRNWVQKLVLTVQIQEQRNPLKFYVVVGTVFVLSFFWIVWMLCILEGGSWSCSNDTQLSERQRIHKRNQYLKHRGSFVQNFKDGVNVVAAQWNSAIKDINSHRPPSPPTSHKKSLETLPQECHRPAWQEFNLPNCNRMHEIDLTVNLLGDPATGFLADGLWRDVFAVRDSVDHQITVLKIMKPKHDVNSRNFDRHRRDALSMERLTSNKNIVDIYGFCGNTVATEFVEKTLYDVIFYGDIVQELSPSTPRGRLQLFIEATEGLMALHEVPSGPIVHADLQARQLLVRNDGSVALNDFNRCRFMGQRNDTHKTPCPFRIPSAPGRKRSPEEYNEEKLDEKLDIFSLGNIYYSILTQSEPFEGLSTKELQSYVIKGTKPDFPHFDNDIDIKLKTVTISAYERDPMKRLSARELLGLLNKIKESATDEETRHYE